MTPEESGIEVHLCTGDPIVQSPEGITLVDTGQFFANDRIFGSIGEAMAQGVQGEFLVVMPKKEMVAE